MSELVKVQPSPDANDLRQVEPRIPGAEVSVRLATQDDFANIDALQKSESDGLGFQFEAAIRKRIEQGDVIVAEATERSGNRNQASVKPSDAEPDPRSPIPGPSPAFAGYCLGVDRYQKRSELGIIYQIGVAREYRRSLVAATLLQAQFDKSAYGTKLYCCWCKQSLAANRFWEAMGFVPLAFRAAGRSTIEKVKRKTGSTAGATQIFWQKRIRRGDTSTPWWYPYETSGGAMMEGRIVLPLPPEMQWHQAAPVVLPGAERRAEEQRLLEAKVSEVEKRERKLNRQGAKSAKKGKIAAGSMPGGVVAPRAVGGGGFGAGSGFGEPEAVVSEDKGLLTPDAAELARIEAEKAVAKKALKDAQRKNDPELVAYARELRDRWQEHVTGDGAYVGMIENKARGRYVIGRLLPGVRGQGDKVEEPAILTPSPAEEDLDGGVKRLNAA
ncbi:MAG: hypothetical protein AAF597_03585 [Bacteroidota bacterium]